MTKRPRLRVACDAYGCEHAATALAVRTAIPRRVYKFCEVHRQKHTMGAGFRVNPKGWDGTTSRELPRA